MVRGYFLALSLCLVLQDTPTSSDESSGQEEGVQLIQKGVIFKDEDLLRQELIAGMAFFPRAFPTSIPWGPAYAIGTKGLYPADFLMHYHPVQFLEMCLERYQRDVRGYSTLFIKRERIGGKLEPMEKLEVLFREEPFSVYMNWLQGA